MFRKLDVRRESIVTSALSQDNRKTVVRKSGRRLVCVCARVQKMYDVHDARFVAGHLWWTDNQQMMPEPVPESPMTRRFISADRCR